LERWGIAMTTVGAQRIENPELLIHRSQPGWKQRLTMMFMNLPFMSGRFPPGFRGTMADLDDRLDEMCIGLGVVTPTNSRFYPKTSIGNGIDDSIDGQPLHISIGTIDQVPFAEWQDGTRPLQLFSRWYGVSLTYPNCDIYGQ